ncbi:MAG: hypothetical protein SGBAC_004125 [Bacillariaceae sp.]
MYTIAPQMCDEPNHQALIYDRFSNCGNDCDAAPTSSHHRRIVNRVHFAPSVHVQPIANRHDFSPEEVHACFHSSEDKDLMYGSYEKTVSRIKAGKRPKKNTSYRGLENFIESNSSQLDNTVHACIDAVMDEQDRQWAEEDYVDWGLFREASLKVSLHSVSLAFKVAAHDENEARKAYISMAKKRRQLQDDASVSTKTTENSKLTMLHDIKTKHNKTKPTDQSVGSSSKKSKTKVQSTSRRTKSPSLGNRKMMGGGLESLKNNLYATKTIFRAT